MDMKRAYYQLRRAYRELRYLDSKWVPDPYADLRGPRDRIPPNDSGAMLASLDARMREAVSSRWNIDPATRRYVPAAVRPGPRTRWYRNWFPQCGRYANLNLVKRVAIRKVFADIKAYERERLLGSPIVAASIAMADEVDKLTAMIEAGTLRMQAMRAYERRQLGLDT